jgi:hypothetical protein
MGGEALSPDSISKGVYKRASDDLVGGKWAEKVVVDGLPLDERAPGEALEWVLNDYVGSVAGPWNLINLRKLKRTADKPGDLMDEWFNEVTK